jgi:hypothetical protein
VCLSRIISPLTFFTPAAHPRLGLNEHIDSPKAYTNRLVLLGGMGYGEGAGEGEAKTQTEGITKISKTANKGTNKPGWKEPIQEQPLLSSFRMAVNCILDCPNLQLNPSLYPKPPGFFLPNLSKFRDL